MTDELFQSLAKYEDVFVRVSARQYQPSPGLVALQTMLKAIREHRPNFRTNFGCSSCVRTLILEAAGLYFTEKDRRMAVAAETPASEPVAPAAEKTAPKRKKTTKAKNPDA